MINNNTAFVQNVSLPVAKPMAFRRLNAVVTSIVLSLLALFGLHSLLSWQPNMVMAAETVKTQSESLTNLKRIEGLNSSKTPPFSELPAKALMALPPLQVADDVVTTTITVTIASATDDVGYHYSDCVAHFDDIGSNLANEIYLGHCDNGNEIISGLRFASVSIPEEANIETAYLEFGYVDGYTNIISPTYIYGEDVSASLTFSLSNLPSQRLDQTTNSFTKSGLCPFG